MVNLPAFFTSLAPTPAKLSKTFMQSDFFNSVAPAKASARPVLVSALPLAFLAAFIAGAMLCGAWRGPEVRELRAVLALEP